MTPTLRRSAGVLSANAANNLAALAITLAAAQRLPPAEFGALGLALAVAVVTATLADWGMGLSLVRAIGRDARAAPAAAAAVLGWKLLLLAMLALLGGLLPLGPVAQLWPGLADRGLLAATLIAAGVLGCWTSRRALAQAHGRFDALRRDALACAVLRGLAFAGVVAAEQVSPLSVLLCLYVAPQALLLLPQLARLRGLLHPGARAAFAALLRYSGWVGVSALCFVAFTRAPVLVLGARGSPQELGVLGAALTLALGLAMIGDALRTVTLPRLLRAGDAARRERARRWVRHTAWPVLALAALGLGVLASAYEGLLGPAHADGAAALLIIGLGLLLAAGLGLENALLHALARPGLEATVNAGRLLAFCALAPALPATATAMALAFAGVLVGGELVLFVAVRRAEPRRALAAVPQP